jgi:predicted  nucleic acid-binding Zn-ribbon protein
MATSKTLNPQLVDLFNRIEQQADEYEATYNSLNKFAREAERIKRQVQDVVIKNDELYKRNSEICSKLESIENYIDMRLQSIYEDIKKYLEGTVIKDFQQKTDALIENFHQKADEALGLITGSEGILELIDKVKNTSKDLTDKMLIVDERIAQLSKQSEVLDKAKADFYTMGQTIDGRISELRDKMVSAISDAHDKFDADFTNARFSLDDKVKNISLDIKNAQSQINQKVRKADDNINNFIKLAGELEEHLKGLQQAGNTPINKKMFDELRTRMESINSHFDNEIHELYSLIATTNADMNKKFKTVQVTDD